MPELGELLREAGTTDVGFGVGDVERRARALRRRQAWVSAAAVLVVLMLVGAGIGLAGGLRGGGETISVATAPPSEDGRPTVSPHPLVDLPRVVLDATPVVPDGWQTVTYGLGQLSVPPDWSVWPPGSTSCDTGRKVLVLGDDVPAVTARARQTCATDAPPWAAIVAVRGLGDDCNGCADGTSHGLAIPADRGVSGVYSAPLQLDVTWDGDIDERIPSTMAPSPAARALADGPLADTTDWQVVRDGSVAALVPPGWPVRQVRPNDISEAPCGPQVFDAPPTAHLGFGRTPAKCLEAAAPAARVPADGVKLVGGQTFESWPDRYRVAIDGASAQGVNRDDPNVVQLQLHDPDAVAIVGLGEDLTIARTILRTITTGAVAPGHRMTTSTLAPGGLRATLELDAPSLASGAKIDGQVILENDTGSPIDVVACGSPFQVALTNEAVSQTTAWQGCAGTVTVPVGRSAWPVTVVAWHRSCEAGPVAAGGSEPACLASGGLPPLPPGRYAATVVTNGGLDVTASADIEVTAP